MIDNVDKLNKETILNEIRHRLIDIIMNDDLGGSQSSSVKTIKVKEGKF
jgi:hypothetical protein